MRETLRLSSLAFKEERAVVMFPSGRIAFWKDGRLNERPWLTTAVSLPRKQAVPIVPVNVRRAIPDCSTGSPIGTPSCAT